MQSSRITNGELKQILDERQDWVGRKMKLQLFTDGSVNTKLKIGYGAYLALPEGQEPLTSNIKMKQFADTSSTKLELQTLLWALSEISAPEVISYTDSQNIVGLVSRRKKIEGNAYYAKNGKLLNNHELYRQFYQLTDNLNISFHQIRGHTPSTKKSHAELIFSLVDRAARSALRAYSTRMNLDEYGRSRIDNQIESINHLEKEQ